MVITLMAALLSGCKAQKPQETETRLIIEETETLVSEETESAIEAEATMLVNEGDVEIIVPEDQDMGGE